MKMLPLALAVMFVLGLASTSSPADRVVLKGGYEVIGQVLKRDEHGLVVDIGAAVLRLPPDQVLRVVPEPNASAPAPPPSSTPTPSTPVPVPVPSPAATPSAVSAPAPQPPPSWQLYHTADLPPTTIEANVARFAEAVVLVRSPAGLGSGFIITADGYLITNYHVIARETLIKVVVFRRTDVGFDQHSYKKVRIVALNPFVDLALLKIEQAAQPFRYVYLGSVDQVETGQKVFAIGNPLGLTRTVSQGIISTRNRNYQGRLYIQTTADVNPGNSGGPLFNLRGQVIGVTSMGYIFLGGLNFAIPVDVVQRFLQNRDAFAYDEDNPNTGYRYLQPSGRENHALPTSLGQPRWPHTP